MTSNIALQVKAGSIFDNILICDDPQYAREVVEDVFQNREVNLLILESIMAAWFQGTWIKFGIWILILCICQIEKDAFEEAEKVRRAQEEEVTTFVCLLLGICNLSYNSTFSHSFLALSNGFESLHE